MARKSGLVLRGGRMRRESLWLAYTTQINTIALGTAVLLDSLNAAALALRPFTVVRSRGFLFIASDQISGAENQAVNYGMTVVTAWRQPRKPLVFAARPRSLGR